MPSTGIIGSFDRFYRLLSSDCSFLLVFVFVVVSSVIVVARLSGMEKHGN